MIRLEEKTTDKRNPSLNAVQPLPEEKHRARIEVALRRSALTNLGLRHLNDLQGFKFESLRVPFFGFWRTTVPNIGAETPEANRFIQEPRLQVFVASGVYGLDLYDEARLAERREWAREHNREHGTEDDPYPAVMPRKSRAETRRSRIAWGDLNGKARSALKGLTRRTTKAFEAGR